MCRDEFVCQFRDRQDRMDRDRKRRILAGIIRVVRIRYREGHFDIEGLSRMMADQLVLEIVDVADAAGLDLYIRCSSALERFPAEFSDIVDQKLVALDDRVGGILVLIRAGLCESFQLRFDLHVRRGIIVQQERDCRKVRKIDIIARLHARQITVVIRHIADIVSRRHPCSRRRRCFGRFRFGLLLRRCRGLRRGGRLIIFTARK